MVYERRVQHGASERMVVSPGHEGSTILHLPGGQSGHPLSPHYRDQYRDWLEARALPLAGQPVNGMCQQL
ncbi:MAG: penicillin acylase family protein [Actinomycetota bacterium]